MSEKVTTVKEPTVKEPTVKKPTVKKAVRLSLTDKRLNSFWRAGLEITHAGTDILLTELTKAQQKALKEEPKVRFELIDVATEQDSD